MEASRLVCRWNLDWYFYFRPGKQADHVISLGNNYTVLLRVFTTVWRDIVSNEGDSGYHQYIERCLVHSGIASVLLRDTIRLCEGYSVL